MHPNSRGGRQIYGLEPRRPIINEFYGDRILYGIIASLLYDFFGLSKSPQFYTLLISDITSNRLLTDLMLNKKACEFVRSGQYTIIDQKRFHNQ